MQSDKDNSIAAFDFDGTITTKDTLFDFLFYYYGKDRVIVGLFALSPILVLYKIGLIKNSVAKQLLFSYFFKNKSITEFDAKCKEYSKRISSICKESTLEKLKEHLNQGHRVIIISASVSNWIKPWASEMGINEVLGTEIEVIDRVITGRFASPNCYGQEKVNRLLALYPHKEQYALYAYGDSSGDKELLKLADYPTLLKK